MAELCFYTGKLTFKDLHLTGEDMYIYKSVFNETMFAHCFFDEASFLESKWDGSRFYFSSFVNTTFAGCVFFDIVFVNCYFNGADFSPYVHFFNCRFYNCTFDETWLRCLNNMFDCLFEECDFRNANIDGEFIPSRVRVSDCVGTPYIPMVCPDEGSFAGYKIARTIGNGYLVMVKLTIPADAKRTSGSERKCRCDKAFVDEITHINGPFSGEKVTKARSDHDPNFLYQVGQMVGPITNFEEDRWITCAEGIHFFMNKKEALRYYGLLEEDHYGRK